VSENDTREESPVSIAEFDVFQENFLLHYSDYRRALGLNQ